MAAQAQWFGLSYFGPGVPGGIGDDGGKFTLNDRLFIDRYLRYLTIHDHAGDFVAPPDPSDEPPTSLDTTQGSLPAGLNIYYRVAYVDQFGLETAASAEAVVAMPAQLVPPDFPTLTAEAQDVSDTNPGVGVGTWSYALTATSGAQETPLGLASQITLDGSLTTVDITVPDLQDGQDGWNIWRKGAQEPGWTKIASLDDLTDDFVDDYATPADPNAADPANAPPTDNLTNSANSVSISCPDPDLFVDLTGPVKRWRIYRTYSSGAYAAESLLVEINETVNPDGSGGLATEFIDDGTVLLQQGQPLNVSQVAQPPTKFRYMVVPTTADLPDPAALPVGFPALAVTGDEGAYELHIVGDDHTWHTISVPNTINFRGVYNAAVGYVLGDVVIGSDDELYLVHVTGPVTGVNPVGSDGTSWTVYPAGASAASGVSYNHTTSGMAATTVQGAIDELRTDVSSVAATVSNITANHQTASYTAVPGDAGKTVEMDVATANVLNIDTHANQPFNVGDTFEVLQYGAGQTTITALAGVTIHSPNGYIKVAVRYGTVTLRYRGSDEWMLEGDLAA